MTSSELLNYLKSIDNDYIEYSFFKNSTEIMEALLQKGLENVLAIESINQISKCIYECETIWNVGAGNILKKKIKVDISGEMLYIVEIL